MPHCVGSNFGKRFTDSAAARHHRALEAEDEDVKAVCREQWPADRVTDLLDRFRKLKREQGDGNGVQPR